MTERRPDPNHDYFSEMAARHAMRRECLGIEDHAEHSAACNDQVSLMTACLASRAVVFSEFEKHLGAHNRAALTAIGAKAPLLGAILAHDERLHRALADHEAMMTGRGWLVDEDRMMLISADGAISIRTG